MLLQPGAAALIPPAATLTAQPRTVLLTSTSWWPFTARIAMRFAALGWRAEALCPSGHPLRHATAVDRVHDYPALWPQAALRSAIAAARPDLIVPCDDRAVGHLHDLHARLHDADPPDQAVADREVARLIARSLGRTDSYPVAARRSELIGLARAEGLRAPAMHLVGDAAGLRAALAEIGLPAVLKVDGSWGGLGTMLVRTAAQAEQAYRQLARPLDAVRALKRLLVDRDPYHLPPWLTGAAPRVNVQAFVAGQPANSLAACWNGDVLASIHVEVLHAHQDLGASTVVRVIEHPEMARATERLVRRLGLSGFCGFDFIVEAGGGHAHLIEMNPRSTPLCHLALGPGRDPIAALVARLEGAASPITAPVTDNPVIAFFPQAWLAEPGSARLRSGYHDVPWEDPLLMQELIRLPYPNRGVLARLLAWLRQDRHA